MEIYTLGHLGHSNDYAIRGKHEVSNYLLQDNHPHNNDRENCDTVTYKGLKIIDFCKSFDLIILNGGTKEGQGQLYTLTKKLRARRLVDVAIISSKIFENL